MSRRILGYIYLSLGLFCMIFFAGQLFLQLLAIFIGFSFIIQGLRILAVDRAIYRYSQNYFNDQSKR